jgi:hypothetical protein
MRELGIEEADVRDVLVLLAPMLPDVDIDLAIRDPTTLPSYPPRSPARWTQSSPGIRICWTMRTWSLGWKNERPRSSRLPNF